MKFPWRIEAEGVQGVLVVATLFCDSRDIVYGDYLAGVTLCNAIGPIRRRFEAIATTFTEEKK